MTPKKRAVAIGVVLSAMWASGFAAGISAGVQMQRNRALPTGFMIFDRSSEPAVTFGSDGDVRFGSSYDRQHEAQQLVDAAKQLVQDQPWPACKLASWGPILRGDIPVYAGVALKPVGPVRRGFRW